jgi:uncharacterized cupredoxin-like copper-binding protein
MTSTTARSGTALALMMALGALAASVSGGGGTAAASTATAAAARTLKLTAVESGGSLRFSAHRLKARHGTVTITMTNPRGDSFEHGIAIEGKGVRKRGRTVQPGGTSTVRATLKPGRYTFYCPVPGHRAAGMRGTLTVR